MIELPQTSRAGRWGTINTKLAACLRVYGYRMCQEQPFIRTAGIKTPDKVSTSIWFEDAHPAGITDATPQDWEVAWRHWDELQNQTGRYVAPPEWRVPFIRMRHSLDTRQYFAQVVMNTRIDHAPPDLIYGTEDVLLAICLVSMGHRLYSNVARRYVFDGSRVGLPLIQQYMDNGQSPIAWAKAAVVQQENLVQEIKNPDNVANIQIKVGRQIAWVPTNMPPSVREPLIRLLNG